MRPRARAAAGALTLACLLLAAPGAGGSGDGAEPTGVRERAAADIADRLAVVDRTDAILAERVETRRERLEMRARAAYALERADPPASRLGAEARRRAVWRRLLSRRLIAREIREAELLAIERDAARDARLEAVGALADVWRAPMPAARALARPVPAEIAAPFGRYRDGDTRAVLSRRGIRFAAEEGDPVAAPGRGEVVFAGALRNRERAVILELEGELRAVVAELAEFEVESGDAVAAEEVIGRAAEGGPYLEVRLPIGSEGFPVDPEPLLEPLEAGEESVEADGESAEAG